MSLTRIRPAVLALALLTNSLACAQPGTSYRTESVAPLSADPSDRVARVSYLQGSVSYRSSTADDWSGASLNYPLTTGDHLWTDDNARAELHVGSSAIRLGSQTAVELLALDDHRMQLRLAQGAVDVRIRSLGDDDAVEVDTPTGAVVLVKPGEYRVDASADGSGGTVTVRHGDAEVTAGGSTFAVHPDQSAVFAAGNGGAYDLQSARPLDDLDDWSMARDRREDEAASARYVSREMTGYEDLDGYGRWRNDPQYGAVWIPTAVAVGWAPYHDGHWAYVEPWGWTWVDAAPWGFAPFHYGRWAYVGGGWAWVPGRVVARPVYAPALVAFVGGSGWSVSTRFGGGGGVAWFPLAPNEVYRPTYRASPTYVRQVNVTTVNVTNINVTNVNVTNVHYANREVSGAVTAVPQDAFVHARPVREAAIPVSRGELAHAPLLARSPEIAPRPVSVAVRTPGAPPVARPPAAVFSRPVVMRNVVQPPVARQMPMSDGPGMVRPPVTSDRGVAYRPTPTSATAPAPVRSTPVQPNADRPPTDRAITDRAATDRPANDRPPMERRAPERGNPAHLPSHSSTATGASASNGADASPPASSHADKVRPRAQADAKERASRRRGEHAPERDVHAPREAPKEKPKEVEREPHR